MVEQVTCGIKITIQTSFEGTFNKNNKVYYSFSYRVSISNQSKDSVQLNSREWIILDALNNTEFVSGDGVIGQKPIISPGKSHTYTSGCILLSPNGAMKGFYNMINFTTTKKFKVAIPTFKLNAPHTLN